MSIKSLKNRFQTLRSQVLNNQISYADAEDKAVTLLADAMYLKNNSVENKLTSEDIIALESFIVRMDEYIVEIQSNNTNVASL